MKILSILLFLIVTMSVKGQDVTVYGRVTCVDKAVKLESVVGIRISYTTKDNSYLTSADVDNIGFYDRRLPNATTITVESNYDDFYAEKVIVDVADRDSIRIDLKLIPKRYFYTREKAIKDTRDGNVHLITFDTLEYNWSRKINLKKDFGFDYVLLAEPDDNNFKKKMDEYNAVVEGYLGLRSPNWRESLGIVRDSVVNSEADQYGRQHKVNIDKLRFPEIDSLPKGMKERLTTLQSNYESWYKDKLKDYTFERTIEIIKKDKEYENFQLLPERVSIEYQKMLPELLKLITDETEIGMKDYPGIMLCRGIAPPPGPWGCVAIPFSRDDLFTVAGRANHLLKVLTQEDFGNVLPNPDKEYLKKLQNRWAYWTMNLNKN